MTRLTTPHQLSPHLFVVYSEHPHRDSSNVYLVTGRNPLLIDCGSFNATPHLLRNIALVNLDIQDVDRVVATHGHCDHAQGFHALRQESPDLRLLIHPLDEPLVQEPDLVGNACHLYNGLFRPIGPDLIVPVVEGDRIPAGDGDLLVMHTPGHTGGSISLLGEVDGHKVLFAGDTVGGSMLGLDGIELTMWADAVTTWKGSLRRITGLDIDWVLNGHEPVSGLPITRQQLHRGIASFGMMLNPWFLLGEDEDEPVPEEPVVTG